VLKVIANACPKAKVRLLICDPKAASAFDSDGKPDHGARIRSTIDAIRLMEVESSEFKIKIFYYRTIPSVSAIIVDDNIVSLSWYCSYLEPRSKLVRLRGHDSATIITSGSKSSILREFARRHLEIILRSAVAIPERVSKITRPRGPR
jgi:hypothetical protein